MKHSYTETFWALVFLFVLCTLFALFAIWLFVFFFPAPVHGADQGPKINPQVYADHLKKFGPFSYMTEKRLREVLKAHRRKPLAWGKDANSSIPASHMPNVWEVIEAFCTPKVRSPRR